jgi:predicted acylesterase/phospholipase RssA
MPAGEPAEHQVRLAVVMYGGSSLAIYINGIVQELLSLVRATAPPAAGPTVALGPTEAVYRRLGQWDFSKYRRLADVPTDSPVRTRVLIDIISGSSAGGINGIFLAKALANEQTLEGLKRLWVDEGDLGRLINDRESRVGLPMLPLADPPRSVLNSQRMYWKLLHALEAMEETTERPNGQHPSRLVDDLDLFTTATDLRGVVLPIQLATKTIHEPRFRKVFKFRYRGGRRNDFTRDVNPFLAYAARCTSSLPFLFEPMKLEDIDEPLKTFRGFQQPDFAAKAAGWRKFYREYLPTGPKGEPDPNAPSDFPQRPFGDGGALDNAPFSYAIDRLLNRISDHPVDRKLVYIEPDPGTYESGGQPLAAPDGIQNVILQGSLPRSETIREDINRVLQRNREATRVQNITRDLVWDVMETADAAHETADLLNQGYPAGGTSPGDSPLPQRPAEWDEAFDPVDSEVFPLSTLLSRHSIAYGGYQRIRVADVTDDYAASIGEALGYDADSEYVRGIRTLVARWRDQRYAHEDQPNKRPFSLFLGGFDLTYDIRRLRLLLSRLDEVASLAMLPSGAGSHRLARLAKVVGSDSAEDLEELTDDLAREAEMPSFAELRSRLAAPLSLLRNASQMEPKAAEIIKRARVSLELRRLESLLSGTRIPRNSSSSSGTGDSGWLDELSLVVQSDRTTAKAEARKELAAILFEPPPGVNASVALLRTTHRLFPEYDQIALPVQYGTGAREIDTVEIYRFGSKDATRLIDLNDKSVTRKKVAGIEYGHMGAFLDANWRRMDILWGRLDAAELIVEMLVPPGVPNRADDVDTLIEEAQREIIKQDRPNDDPGAYLQHLRTDFSAETKTKLEPLMRSMARLTHVGGQVLKGIAETREVKPAVSPMKWVARLGRLLMTMVEAAIPGKITHLFARHWVTLAFVFSLLLILGGSLLGAPEVVSFGWTALGITSAFAASVLAIGDFMRGGGGVAVGVLRLLLLLAVLLGALMILLEAPRLGDDLGRNASAYRANLPLEARIVDQPWWLALLAGVVLAFVLILGWLTRSLRGPESSGPHIDLQLAGSSTRVIELKEAWGPSGVSKMRAGIWLDFVFLLVYGVALYIGVVWAKHQWTEVWPPLTWIGVVLAVGALLAACLDAVENTLMLLNLSDAEPSDRHAATVRTLALAKFALVGVGFAYFLAGLARFSWSEGLPWLSPILGIAVLTVLILTARQLEGRGIRRTKRATDARQGRGERLPLTPTS